MIAMFLVMAMSCAQITVEEMVEHSKTGVEKAKEISRNVHETVEEIKAEKQKVDEEFSKRIAE